MREGVAVGDVLRRRSHDTDGDPPAVGHRHGAPDGNADRVGGGARRYRGRRRERPCNLAVRDDLDPLEGRNGRHADLDGDVRSGTRCEPDVSPGFAAWKAFAASYRDIPVAGLIALSSPGALNPYDAYAYDAPFPDARYKAGVRRFPQLVPVEPGMAGAAEGERARRFLAQDWRGESFMAIGLRDPVLGKPVMEELRSAIRGCPPPLEIPEAGHFVQEWGEPVARAALASFGFGPPPA